MARLIAEKRRRLAESPEDLYGRPSPLYNPQPKHLEVERQLKVGRRYNLLVGGSRSGKTFIYIKHIIRRALIADGSRHAVFRFRGNAARTSIWLDTLPKVQRLCYPGLKFQSHSMDGYLETPNGSEIWIGGLDEKERVEKILGQEHATIFLNECSQIPFSSVLTARTRLAQVCHDRRGRVLIQQELKDLNPVGRSHYSHREHIQGIDPENRRPIKNFDRDYFFEFLQPQDNAANLDPAYIESLANAPARYRRRFYEGQYVDDVEGALWTMEALDHARCDLEDVPDTLDRVVVAVDPSGTDGDEDTRSDDIGIVVAGRSGTGDKSCAYLLKDLTCNEPPEVWGRRVVQAFRDYGADRIVAEANYGGEMVKFVVDTAARGMRIVLPPVQLVKASRGKAVRAEPVSVLCGHLHNEEWVGDRVVHAGEFVELEEELLNFSVYGYLGPKSPNRADAYVWALTDLMLGEQVPSLWSRRDIELVQ